MKYIVTKDGRIIDLNSKQVSSYEIIDDKTAVDKYGEISGFICVYYYDEDIGEHIEYDGKGSRSMDNWYLKDIVKQADTIEELCDGYVVESDDGWYGFKIINFAKQDYHIRERYQEQNIILYGFIKTDKGLIYVAKMKGILPNGEIDWELL